MAIDADKDRARLEAKGQSADCPECGGEGLTTRWAIDDQGRERSHAAYCHLCPMGRWVEERHRLDAPAVWRRIPDLASFPAEQDPIRQERPSWRGAVTVTTDELARYQGTPAELLRRLTAHVRGRMAAEKHDPRPRQGALAAMADHVEAVSAIVAAGPTPDAAVPDEAWRKADAVRRRHQQARAAVTAEFRPRVVVPADDDAPF
jgi:hypothetical protein